MQFSILNALKGASDVSGQRCERPVGFVAFVWIQILVVFVLFIARANVLCASAFALLCFALMMFSTYAACACLFLFVCMPKFGQIGFRQAPSLLLDETKRNMDELMKKAAIFETEIICSNCGLYSNAVHRSHVRSQTRSSMYCCVINAVTALSSSLLTS